MIQIDGLGLDQLKKALAQGRMPFLARLMEQGHQLTPMYSGLPSATPAVQAELFFGLAGAIPAFEYIDRSTGERCVFHRPACADRLGARAAQAGPGLLSGGASYGDVLTGQAARARYTLESLSVESMAQGLNPLRLGLVLVLRLPRLLRVASLVFLELGLALAGLASGIIGRQGLPQELKFVPARILFSVVLRELIRFHVKQDILEGLPIIHANLAGYDEQAHRRGPSSAFAHWTLKGIDAVIRDIHRAIPQKNGEPGYELIIHSDHGQEKAAPFARAYGRAALQAVSAALGRAGQGLLLASSGPLGHVYLARPAGPRELEAMALDLARKAHIPLVIFKQNQKTRAARADGLFSLPGDWPRLLGRDHPFGPQAAEDLARLARHPDAGDLVISGWRPGQPPLTFAAENGAHGGPGAREVGGFVLAPPGLVPASRPVRPASLGRAIRARLKKNLSN